MGSAGKWSKPCLNQGPLFCKQGHLWWEDFPSRYVNWGRHKPRPQSLGRPVLFCHSRETSSYIWVYLSWGTPFLVGLKGSQKEHLPNGGSEFKTNTRPWKRNARLRVSRPEPQQKALFLCVLHRALEARNLCSDSPVDGSLLSSLLVMNQN